MVLLGDVLVRNCTAVSDGDLQGTLLSCSTALLPRNFIKRIRRTIQSRRRLLPDYCTHNHLMLICEKKLYVRLILTNCRFPLQFAFIAPSVCTRFVTVHYVSLQHIPKSIYTLSTAH